MNPENKREEVLERAEALEIEKEEKRRREIEAYFKALDSDTLKKGLLLYLEGVEDLGDSELEGKEYDFFEGLKIVLEDFLPLEEEG